MIDRRQFLGSSSALVAASILARAFPALGHQAAAPPVTKFEDLRRGVGLFTGNGGTIGWYIGKDAVLVVDSQFPNTAQICVDGLKTRSARGIDTLVNTHHHGDHTAGNVVFKPLVKHIVAHARVPELQKKAAAAAGTEANQAYADMTFTDSWKADMGDEVVHATHYGPAHTGGDSVVFFERANVVHMGDLVFNRLHPYVDRPAGASILNWVTTLGKVAGAHDADTIYVFGHGNEKFGVTGRKADLAKMADYLTAVLNHVHAGVKAGKTRDEITKVDDLPGYEEYTWPGRRMTLSSVLNVAWEEVTEKE